MSELQYFVCGDCAKTQRVKNPHPETRIYGPATSTIIVWVCSDCSDEFPNCSSNPVELYDPQGIFIRSYCNVAEFLAWHKFIGPQQP